MVEINSLQDIKKRAYNVEDPETAIEQAIMDTCCFIRKQIFTSIDEMDDGKNAQGLYMNMGLNDAQWKVVELIKKAREDGFKGKSWREKNAY